MIQLKKFLKEESGQTTTEYVLILLVVVTVIMQFKGKMLATVIKLLGGIEKGTSKIMEENNYDG